MFLRRKYKLTLHLELLRKEQSTEAVGKPASLRKQGSGLGQHEGREACPHLEAKATLDTLRDALMLSQLTTKHCIPKGGSSKLRDKDQMISAENMYHPPWLYFHST